MQPGCVLIHATMRASSSPQNTKENHSEQELMKQFRFYYCSFQFELCVTNFSQQERAQTRHQEVEDQERIGHNEEAYRHANILPRSTIAYEEEEINCHNIGNGSHEER